MDIISYALSKKYVDSHFGVNRGVIQSQHTLKKKLWFDFEDSLWNPRIAGQVSADTQNVRYGTQGMRITYTGEASWADVTFPKISLDGKLVLVSMYVEDVEEINGPRFTFRVNGNWSNSLATDIEVDAPFYRNIKSGWNYLIIGKEKLNALGNATFQDITNIDGIRITQRSNVEGSFVTVDSIWIVDKPINRPLFTVTFDDGYISDYTVARPILSRYGYRGVSYVVTSAVGNAGRMDLEQLKTLYEMGWDISNHTATHKYANSTPINEWVEDLNEGHQWLVDNGFVRSAGHCAYPGGQNTKEILWEVEKRHKTGRINIRASGETVPPSNPYLLNVYPILTSSTLQNVKNAIDLAIEKNQWLIFMFHGIDENPEGEGWVTPSFFEGVISYLAEKNAEVVTLSDLSY